MKQLGNMDRDLGEFTGGQLHVRLNGPVKDGGKMLTYDLDKFDEKGIDVVGNIVADIDRHIDDNVFFGWVTKGYVKRVNNGND